MDLRIVPFPVFEVTVKVHAWQHGLPFPFALEFNVTSPSGKQHFSEIIGECVVWELYKGRWHADNLFIIHIFYTHCSYQVNCGELFALLQVLQFCCFHSVISVSFTGDSGVLYQGLCLYALQLYFYSDWWQANDGCRCMLSRSSWTKDPYLDIPVHINI